MMNIDDIRNSGLLELYVLGQLDSSDQGIVMEALNQYPELREDVKEIESSLEKYAQQHAVQPPINLKQDILNQLAASKHVERTTDTSTGKRSGLNGFLIPLLISTIGLAAVCFYNSSKNSALANRLIETEICCEELDDIQTKQMAIYNDLIDENNNITEISATPKYPETKLYIHTNSSLEKNFIQIQQLPELAANQSFQLWALKGTDAPVPLEVFESDSGKVIEVSFVSNPDAYAITIEPKGGSQSPTLENLIGVFNI